MKVSKGVDTDVAKIVVKDTSYFKSIESDVLLSKTSQIEAPKISIPVQLPTGVVEEVLVAKA